MARTKRLSGFDLEAIRDQIANNGELRIHIQHSRSGLTTKARLWRPDGHILGSASGGGYDKAGAALGEAISTLFPSELFALELPKRRKNGSIESGLYGLREVEGKRYLEGACGLDSMLRILGALGFEVEKYDTGKLSDLIVAKRAPGIRGPFATQADARAAGKVRVG